MSFELQQSSEVKAGHSTGFMEYCLARPPDGVSISTGGMTERARRQSVFVPGLG